MNRPASSGLRRRLRLLVVFTSLIALLATTFSLPASTPAHAALAAAGPLDPATKFPFWYQDAAGLRLGYCFDPVNCFLGAQLPDPTKPPSVPNNFPAEMFYWDADASMPTNNGGQAFMRLGLEAAFLPGPGVVDGDQVTFGRIRFRLDNLQAGATYTITHPYGVDTFVAQTALRRGINATTDVGCVAAVAGVACNVSLALGSRIGPFLTWDPAVAPAPPAGYIGNFSVPHRVTGSPLGTNVFRVDGPNVGGPGVNSIQTDQFQVSGKISAVSPGPVPPTPSVVQLSPASLNFGSVTRQATPAPQRVTVTNTGTAVLTITRIAIGGANPGDFAIAARTCGGTLAPAASCTADVTFRPTALGARSGTLAITDNAAGSPHSVALTGTGV